MTAPSKSWVAIADSQVDADSPLDSVLMTAYRDDVVFLKEWLGYSYAAAAAQDHNHDGANSALVTAIADAAISQIKLKTATASGSVLVGTSADTSYGLTGGSFSFWTGSADSTSGSAPIGFGNGNVAAGVIGLHNGSGTNHYFYVDERYIQASPPYIIGNAKWGHFFYVMRKIATGEILGTCEAPDPTWANHGDPDLTDKNDPQRIISAPHPFAEYWKKDPAADGIEIVLLDLRNFNIDIFKAVCQKKGLRPALELVNAVKPGAEIVFSDLGFPSKIPGLTIRAKL